MIDFLLGVPGKLKTISDYLTTNLAAVRTAKIDQLDASVSSRAPASTAVSNVDYTPALATLLASGVIKSVQQGSTLSSGGAAGNSTITAVNLSKSICIFNGSSSGQGWARLTSSTNVQVTADATIFVFWTVLEFN